MWMLLLPGREDIEELIGKLNSDVPFICDTKITNENMFFINLIEDEKIITKCLIYLTVDYAKDKSLKKVKNILLILLKKTMRKQLRNE